MKRSLTLLAVAMMLSACSLISPQPTQAPSHAATPSPSQQVAATDSPTPTAAPTPVKATFVMPSSFASLGLASWQQLLAAPDTYAGQGYLVWGCISQFDASHAQFLAQTWYQWTASWWPTTNDAMVSGTSDELASLAAGDVFLAKVVVEGPTSVVTQTGGKESVPAFLAADIHKEGTC